MLGRRMLSKTLAYTGWGAFLISLLSALCVLAPAPASAQSEPAHLGVQMRMSAGPLYLHATQDVGAGQSENISGSALGFAFTMGSMISERWSLGLDLMLGHAPSASRGVLASTNFSMLHVGAGATYWFMPANLYVAGSLGVLRSSVEASPIRVGSNLEIPSEEVSKLGFGLHLDAGKLFWLDRRFGMGAAASLLFGAAENQIAGTSSVRYLVGVGVTLTLTFH